jgi:hypothetical protein
MSNLAIAERLFKRDFSSEAARDELIGEKADGIAKDITAMLLTNDSEAMEIAGDLFGCMEPETGARVLRAMLNPQTVEAGRLLILAEMGKTIANTAELRAIKQVEAMEPADCLPGN